MKRFAGVRLAAVLACTGFTACGEEKEKEQKLEKVTLNEVAHSIFYAPSMWRLKKDTLKMRGWI